MAKFHGKIGFVMTEETAPGVHTLKVEEREYTGEVLRNHNRWESTEQLNDNFNINNRFSIVGDPYLYENFRYIKYLVLMESKWKINTIEIQRPRVFLNLGGLYNG